MIRAQGHIKILGKPKNLPDTSTQRIELPHLDCIKWQMPTQPWHDPINLSSDTQCVHEGLAVLGASAWLDALWLMRSYLPVHWLAHLDLNLLFLFQPGIAN